jgi:hypothetical protein
LILDLFLFFRNSWNFETDWWSRSRLEGRKQRFCFASETGILGKQPQLWLQPCDVKVYSIITEKFQPF